jgi:hypothetical protein
MPPAYYILILFQTDYTCYYQEVSCTITNLGLHRLPLNAPTSQAPLRWHKGQNHKMP